MKLSTFFEPAMALARLGLVPSGCRARFSFGKSDSRHGWLVRLMEVFNMEYEEKQLEKINVVGLTVKTTMNDAPTKCKKVWEEFMTKWGVVKNRKNDKTWYGPCKDCTEDGVDFISMAGVETEDLDTIPEGMEGWTIPAATYLVFTHKGDITKIGELWGQIYQNEDLPIDKKAMSFEFYDENFKPGSDDSLAYIYVKKT